MINYIKSKISKWKRAIPEVDCSTIKVSGNTYNEIGVGGFYSPMNGYITLICCDNNIDINCIIKILNHEILHKVLHETIGNNSSSQLDTYLEKKGLYNKNVPECGI
jgi:hypothetical protein